MKLKKTYTICEVMQVETSEYTDEHEHEHNGNPHEVIDFRNAIECGSLAEATERLDGCGFESPTVVERWIPAEDAGT